MKIFLFLGSRRGYAVLKKLIEIKANICGILCLIEDPHEEQFHPRIHELSKQNNIPIFFSDTVKPSGYEDLLKELNPEIVFAIGWRYLISKSAYSVPARGTLIIHDSLLPAYRGFAPMKWAIINGEKKTGVTLFYIADGVDSGPIVDQLETEILMEDTAQTIDEKIISLYEKIIVKNLELLEKGTAKSIPQDETRATYTCKRTPADGKINWHDPAEKIYNLIRGLTHPFPGAYTFLNGKKLLIWKAKLPTQKDHYVGNIPGRFIGKKQGLIEVLTGQGVLQLAEVQYENEDILPAEKLKVSVKDTFGW